jgi:hypothetical protein
VPGPHRRAPREESGYRESANQIESDVERCDKLTEAAVARIERDADNCEVVGGAPLMDGHGPLRVSQASSYPDWPELQVFFTLHEPDDDKCSLWFVRQAPGPMSG